VKKIFKIFQFCLPVVIYLFTEAVQYLCFNIRGLCGGNFVNKLFSFTFIIYLYGPY